MFWVFYVVYVFMSLVSSFYVCSRLFWFFRIYIFYNDNLSKICFLSSNLKVEKRALCAFDNKRVLLDDGIHTLAIGHNQVTASVEQDRVENPGGDSIMSESDARRVGLLWSKRRGATNRVDRHLAHLPAEREDEEIAAGHRIRARARERIAQIPDHPDRYDPVAARPPSRRARSPSSTTPHGPKRKLKRVEIDLTSDEEMETEPTPPGENPISTAGFHRGLARLDSDSEADHPPAPLPNSRPSSVLSNDELPLFRPNLIRLGRGGARHRRARRRVPHPFILSEAEESEDEPASPSETSLPHSAMPSHSDNDSASESDSDDSFVVSDDNFE